MRWRFEGRRRHSIASLTYQYWLCVFKFVTRCIHICCFLARVGGVPRHVHERERGREVRPVADDERRQKAQVEWSVLDVHIERQRNGAFEACQTLKVAHIVCTSNETHHYIESPLQIKMGYLESIC